ncbi:hypothetical protein FEM48_Zijuj02G0084400 [Ziziphus jujuba var. spinosa]|uniref:Transcription factor IBH1-like n=1 Tax=Ziziphus jujuba var. spinosa TaxID=714518 RepID=A0A978VUN9_ZIZJJ|nr:hypothetical protein FEM48_Zijuj02G0084400 [Ziziphus jujuba var. spinosa]
MCLKMLTTLSVTLRFTYTEIFGKWSIGDLAFGINYFIRREVSHSSIAAQKDPPTFWSAGFRTKKKELDEKEVGNLEAMEIRKLVPDREAMEIYKLLDETAHYIKCLTIQVKVMTRIADFYSPN